MLPSGLPMISSWGMPPLWVKKLPPVCSVMLCSRPLESESWTRSPASKTPRFCTDTVLRVMDDGEGAYHARMDELTLKATLSPSRISDFNSCPLKFRYRNIDRIPERPGIEAFRGTVVHKVLEDLFDLPRDRKSTRLNSSHT